MSFPKLIVLRGESAGLEVEVNKTPFSIGRESSNYLVLTDDSVSREHATIIRKNNGFQIVDSSSNGTFINGNRVQRSDLRHGDTITFVDERFMFQFVNEEEHKAKPITNKPVVVQANYEAEKKRITTNVSSNAPIPKQEIVRNQLEINIEAPKASESPKSQYKSTQLPQRNPNVSLITLGAILSIGSLLILMIFIQPHISDLSGGLGTIARAVSKGTDAAYQGYLIYRGLLIAVAIIGAILVLIGISGSQNNRNV